MRLPSSTAVALAMLLACQVIAQEAGSSEAYNFSRDAARAGAQAEISWRTAKKIGSMKEADFPANPRKSTMLASLRTGEPARIEALELEVVDVAGPSDLLLRNGKKGLVWLEKHATKDIVDGDNVRILGFIKVVGTKTYETALGGSSTVKLIQLVSEKENAKLDAAELAAMTALAEQEKLERHPEWRLKDGTKFRARFERYFATQVELIALESQELVQHKLTDFVAEDAAKIRKLIQEQAEAAKAAKQK